MARRSVAVGGVVVKAGLVSLVVGLASVAEVSAQDWWWQLTYNMGTPAGSTADFVGTYSFRGFGFQGRKLIDFEERWSVGFDLSWQVFSEANAEDAVVAVDPRTSLSGSVVKYINAFPLLASVHYYLGGERGEGTLGWVGANAGAYYMERRTDAGVLAFTQDSWHVGGGPEVGIAVPAGQTVLTGTVRYHWTAPTNDLDYRFWTFAVGLASP